MRLPCRPVADGARVFVGERIHLEDRPVPRIAEQRTTELLPDVARHLARDQVEQENRRQGGGHLESGRIGRDALRVRVF